MSVGEVCISIHDCWSADRHEKMVALPFPAEILYTKMDYGLRGMPTSSTMDCHPPVNQHRCGTPTMNVKKP